MEQTPYELALEEEETLVEEILLALFLFRTQINFSEIKEAYTLGTEYVVNAIDWDLLRSNLSSIVPLLLAAYKKGGDSAFDEKNGKYNKLDLSSIESQRFLAELNEMIDGLVDATRNGVIMSTHTLIDQETKPTVAAGLIIALLGNIQAKVSGILSNRKALIAAGTPISNVKASVNNLSDKGLLARAENIAENELYEAVSEGRNNSWLQWAALGLIPLAATKTWYTRADEFVCPVCGPLHKVTININATYPGGIRKAPAHNKCRCHERLN